MEHHLKISQASARRSTREVEDLRIYRLKNCDRSYGFRPDPVSDSPQLASARQVRRAGGRGILKPFVIA